MATDRRIFGKENKFSRISNWVKEHQAVIFVVIGVAGLLTLYFSYQAYVTSEKQEELARKTNIDLELSYTTNNLELVLVSFKPQSDDIQIKSFEVNTPSGFIGDSIINELGSKWHSSQFNDNLYETYVSYFKIPDVDDLATGVLAIDECIPISIKYKLVYKGLESEVTNIYKASFRVYKKESIRIRSIALYRTNIESSREIIKKNLNDIDIQECLKFELQKIRMNNKIKASRFEKFYLPLLSNTFSALRKVKCTLRPNRHDSIILSLPVIVADSASSSTFKKNLAFLLDNKDSLDGESKFLLQEIEKFLIYYPLCYKPSYECLIKNHWSTDSIQKNWYQLNDSLLSAIKIYTGISK